MSVASAPLIHLTETGSTNAEAMARALSGAALPFWLMADRQTAGKGRAGRTWVSTGGNLQISLALALNCAPATAAQLSLVAGVAVIEALCRIAPERAGGLKLKWPNDILLEHAKLGGILIETASRGAGCGLIAIVGVGVNVASAPAIEGRAVSALSTTGHHTSVSTLVAALRESMDSALVLWEEGAGFRSVRARWLMAALPVGTPLRVHVGPELAEGAFAGLDEDGALLIDDLGGCRRRFTFGDVTLAT